MKQVPVYLFNGFLECGKTKFIQETLQDERFGRTDKTLILVCEEGELDYSPELFALDNYKIVRLEEEDFDFTNLTAIDKDFKPDTIMLEYNGMWDNDKLFSNLPERWAVAQVMTFIDSNTFEIYNQNMRQQTFEKISIADLVVFNRFDFNKFNQQAFHKAVRAITRRCEILYETESGEVIKDDIVDPLPYDINADVIEINEQDYAYFYRDISEEVEKYNGKTVKFLGQIGISNKMPVDTILIGRHIMTCCEADIEYSPLVAVGKRILNHMDWAIITAKISVEKHVIYKGEGPVLKIIKLEKSNAPKEKVVTFY